MKSFTSKFLVFFVALLFVFQEIELAVTSNTEAKSGSYVIDPDGEGGVKPFKVLCNMTDKGGIGVTVVSHDSENRTLVDGFEDPGS